MRPLLLSTSDVTGGAARSAYRLHLGLRSLGIDSQMLVQHRTSSDPTVFGPHTTRERLHGRLGPHLDRLALRVRGLRARSAWSTQWLANPIAGRAQTFQPDIVHLHWVGAGFVPIGLLGHWSQPIVWTLHDMWPLTGGCHYDDGCGRFRQQCGQCPVLSSDQERDVSRRVWRRKRDAWSELPISIVAPSKWLATCARESSLFRRNRIEVIPYGLPLDRFRPVDKPAARDLLGLPIDGRLLAFGAVGGTTDPRKGYDLLVAALRRLATRGGPEVGVVVFGASQGELPEDLGLPTRFLGHLHDDVSLALAYSAADVFVAPSRQDNLPNTVLEATACGTPTVAFDIGGMSDLVEHNQTGYLAKPFDVDDLAEGMLQLLTTPGRRAEFGQRARVRAEREFGLARQATRYAALYSELLARPVSAA